MAGFFRSGFPFFGGGGGGEDFGKKKIIEFSMKTFFLYIYR